MSYEKSFSPSSPSAKPRSESHRRSTDDARSLAVIERLKAIIAVLSVSLGAQMEELRYDPATHQLVARDLDSALTPRSEHSKPVSPGRSPHDTYIDKLFLHESLSPEILQRGLEGIFGPLLHKNVRVVGFSSESIRMGGSYRGPARYEAGHCTVSSRQGERSDIVLTVDGLPRGVSVEDFLETLIHELAHSIDWRNADDMPEHIEGVIGGALSELVRGDQQTVYSYVNGYEAGPQATPSEEDEEEWRQRGELFAEIVQDFIRMPPLPAHDPLHRLPLAERYAHRFSLRHNISLQEAARYVRVVMAVEAWQQGVSDQGFFEKAQTRYARFAQELSQARQRLLQEERNQLRVEYERRQQLFVDRMEHWVYPELSSLLQIPDGGEGSVESHERDLLQPLFSHGREVFRERARAGAPSSNPTLAVIEDSSRTLEPQNDVSELVPGAVEASERMLQFYRAYLRSLAQPIHSPELQVMFSRLAGSNLYDGRLRDIRTDLPLALLQHRYALQSPRTPYTDNRAGSDEGDYYTFEDIEEVGRMLWKAEHDSDASPRDRQAFREALQRFVAEESQHVWWRRYAETHPEDVRLAEELRRVRIRERRR